MQLNGLRLELGEVEGVLCGCSLVRRAAALLHRGCLVAFVEPACDGLVAAPAAAPAAATTAAPAAATAAAATAASAGRRRRRPRPQPR